MWNESVLLRNASVFSVFDGRLLPNCMSVCVTELNDFVLLYFAAISRPGGKQAAIVPHAIMRLRGGLLRYGVSVLGSRFPFVC